MKHIWLTGISGSGKTTIAAGLLKSIPNSVLVDGDVLRKTISKDLGFTESNRHENCMRAATYIKTLKNTVAVICLCAPSIKTRKEFRKSIDVYEIYLKCDVSVCTERDPKGLYAMYHKGLLKNMVGYDIPYEEYSEVDLVIDTSKTDISSSVSLITSLYVA